jgi:predicted TIM-barrel fold metal-dependent hydrolase
MLPVLPEPLVDFHVHLFPDRFFDAIWRYFKEQYGFDVLHKIYYRECVEYLRERGVGPIVYSNYAHRKGVAATLNEWNLRVVDEIPDLYCFAAYHPDDEDAVAMASELLEHPKILGFKLQLLVQRFYPHDERLFPLYERILEKQKRILFHVGTGPVGNRWVGVSPFKKALQAFPDLQANIAHMGALEYRDFMDLLENHPGLHLDTSFSFLPQMPFQFDLGNECLERFRSRILYGSDFPNLLFPREEEIGHLASLRLSPEFYRKVFRENGLALIGRT